MKSKFILILAIVMGLMTTFLFFNYMKQFDSEIAISESMVEIVVAKERIPANTMVQASMLEVRSVPEQGVHPQAIRNLSELEGLYVTSPIEVGEAILEHRVQSSLEENVFVSRKVSDGHRAVSIGVDFVQSVSTLIEPEDYVDVVFSEIISTNPNVIKSEQILTNVRVLAVGTKMIPKSDESEEYVEYTSVTLDLKPQDAVTVINASERGNIQFTLNSKVATK
ncbi:pilus assembly protein CpaB [Bacillus mesophilus]|uniref:Flp pilus assembly protein CpaB n=1 Tax=Bacillus mesophilus TaxID=1808955 RepID=A0A6M0Q683_9BACI|nr:Flp pilus assembly protein CpaB [Bacillus mesophilus]MBM7660297.1 pilus assembly protein CpaB [Bacillus mesophilus]NEY71010.1 Flp pilus assembly protein CpaB [Bacillus mesophilus]